METNQLALPIPTEPKRLHLDFPRVGPAESATTNAPRRRTGYGIHDYSRSVARRVRQAWEAVESPELPSRRSVPIEKRPLAA
jgi:hypothetical protein